MLQREGFRGWVFDPDWIDLAPSPERRAWLEEREKLLQLWLRPAGNDRVRSQLASLIATMKRRNAATAQIGNAIVETYLSDLVDAPFFGLVEACTAFRRNEVGDGWLPTPGELRQEAQLRAMWAQQELADISAILIARVPDRPPPLDVRKAAVARYREIIRPTLDHATEPNRKPLPEPGTLVMPRASPRLLKVLAAQNARRAHLDDETAA